MSFQGSNRFQMRAMDLQGHGRQPAAPAGDNGALSARTLLIRRKLMERKRFDSADYAMDKNKRQKDETGADAAAEGLAARAGAAALLSALQDQPEQVQVQVQEQAQAQEQEQRAARYGGLARGGAGAARSILLQKKLREKKHFDSADYQLARQGGEAAARALVVGVSPADSDNEDTDGSSPMDVDEDARINSPSAARVGIAAAISDGDHRIVQMSPSLRGGERPAAFDAASPTHPYAVVDADKQRFFVPAGEPTARSADAAQPQGGQSKYGRLCAANVLIRRKLKERKRFDSADYAMEKQSEQETNEPAVDEGGSSGAIRGGHVVMMSPTKHHRRQSTDATAYGMTRGDTSPSISHQVKHIKLSEEARGGNGMGWASAVATSSVAGVDLGRATSASQDSRLAARNIILQRKLAERKKFDSADYYKSRSTTSG